MEEAGPRRAEAGRICKSHMPTIEQLADVIERDEPWLISVKRKGGNMKPIEAPPDLLVRTLDYLRYGRRDIVLRCQGDIIGYREPDEVFLSSTTGLALHPDSITSIGRLAFSRAGIERASPHRLRARFAVRIIEELVESICGSVAPIGAASSWFDTILIKAAEKMGQSNPRSLRPYLTYVLNRRIQTADATKAGKLAARTRQLERQVNTWVGRLRPTKELYNAGLLIRANRREEAAGALRQIADSLC